MARGDCLHDGPTRMAAAQRRDRAQYQADCAALTARMREEA